MYSQNLEEQHILEYFKDKSGTFLDLGCNDCKTFSNTRALFETGRFKGVLVDPSPKAIAKCRELYDGYKGIYIYEYAISSNNGKKILQESGPLISSRDVALVSTFHDSEMKRFRTTVNYTPIEVKTFRWKTFLNRIPIKQFDMLSVDCEGSDVEIISQMDLSFVKLIVAEWNSKDETRKEILYYTSKYDLNKVIYTSCENIIICR
jgi:FkbM family methyltransferase